MKIMRQKNCIRKLLSFLTIICCLAGSISPVYAAGRENTPAVPRVTFTNRPNESPDLFVTKTVENALSGAAYAAPEHAAYQFTLKLGGQPAKNEKYRVLDAGGREIVRKTSSGRDYPFQTDRAGTFTLEAGQTAWFEYAGTGTVYEVTEDDDYLLPYTEIKKEEIDGVEVESTVEKTVPGGYKLYVKTGENTETLLHEEFDYQTRSLTVDGYVQKSPSGGSTGASTILANGSTEVFVNRYTGKGTGETTKLEIEKMFSFPTDYEKPEAPEFSFTVEIDGKPYRNEEYTAVNTETGASESGMTDGDGQFTMKGGWKAAFEEIPTNVDYKVRENTDSMPEGWWPAGETEKKGSTQSPLTSVGFTNSNVSFVVTKRMEDYSRPDTAFNFLLTDEYGNALAGKKYYLYYTTGVPVYKDEVDDGFDMQSLNDDSGSQPVMVDGKEIVTGETWPNGCFQLKPGQAALFVGMQPGTSFKVTEMKDPYYTQILPLPENNGTHTVGGNGQILAVDFVNKPVDNLEGTLSVTKTLQFLGEGPLEEEEFHFILYKRLMTLEEAKTVLELDEDADENAVQNATKDAVNSKGWLLSRIEDSGDILMRPGAGNANQGILLQSEQLMTMQSAQSEQAVPEENAPEGEGDANPDLLQADMENQSANSRMAVTRPDESQTVNQGWGYKQGEDVYGVYFPVEGKVYSIPEGLSAPTYSTGTGAQAGEFTLKANQTAIFEGMNQEDEYMVREISLTPEYTESLLGPYQPVYGGINETGMVVNSGMLAQVGICGLFEFTNRYTPRKIDLYLQKVDENDQAIKVTDENGNVTYKEAYFMLYLGKGKEHPVLTGNYQENTGASKYYYATVNGELTIPDLKAGTYWLYEEKAPSGYSILAEPIEIEIARQIDGTLKVIIDGREVQVDNESGSGTVDSSVIGAVEIKYDYLKQAGDEDEDGNAQTLEMERMPIVDLEEVSKPKDQLSITVRNVELYELPSSGGMGIYWYSIGGMLLMMAASLILYRNKHRGEVLKD